MSSSHSMWSLFKWKAHQKPIWFQFVITMRKEKSAQRIGSCVSKGASPLNTMTAWPLRQLFTDQKITCMNMSMVIRKSTLYGHFTKVLHRNTGSLANEFISVSFALMTALVDLRQEHCSIKNTTLRWHTKQQSGGIHYTVCSEQLRTHNRYYDWWRLLESERQPPWFVSALKPRCDAYGNRATLMRSKVHLNDCDIYYFHCAQTTRAWKNTEKENATSIIMRWFNGNRLLFRSMMMSVCKRIKRTYTNTQKPAAFVLMLLLLLLLLWTSFGLS